MGVSRALLRRWRWRSRGCWRAGSGSAPRGPGASDRAVSGAGPRGLLRGRPPHPRVGRGALRRAGDRVHPIPAAVLPAPGHPLMARLGLVDRARARERAVVAALGRRAGRRAELPPGAPAVRAPRAAAQRPARRDRRACGPTRSTPAVAPRLTEFARGAIRFDRHYSGGNSSRAGMFSLFYGLPATYFDAFADLARPAGADGPVPPARLPARDCSPARRSTARSSGSIGRPLPACPNLRLETSSPYPGSSGTGPGA